jgi:hypothetical protein
MMTFATLETGTEWPNPAWSTFLFRKLLENESFKTAFIVRFTDQLNTALKPACGEVGNQMNYRQQLRPKCTDILSVGKYPAITTTGLTT